jgi:hypothetical protein
MLENLEDRFEGHKVKTHFVDLAKIESHLTSKIYGEFSIPNIDFISR